MERNKKLYFKIENDETDKSYEVIDFERALTLKDWSHNAHCSIFSRTVTELFEDYKSSALISMQMRFDGTLGFHGGIVDEGTDILTGLNRELKEEINLKPKFNVTQEDYVITHINASKKSCYHFYAKEVAKEEFQIIEYDTLSADEYGIETFGLVRVPMFVMRDHIRGLPVFLKNQFAGCAKIQLLHFLVLKKLCSYEELQMYLNKS